MKYYRLQRAAFWGDYGNVLAQGYGPIRDAKTGQLLLKRAGPFAPPMMFTIEPLVGFVVLVTQSFREKLEAANLGALTFTPTIKQHIVRIPWETWDRQAKLPPLLPNSGEPEDYISGQKHSEQAAAEMENIWELKAPELFFQIEKRERMQGIHYRWLITNPKGAHGGLFRPKGNPILFIDEARRAWFEREGQGWVDFDEVEIV